MHTPSTANAPIQCMQYDVSLFVPGAAQGGQAYFIDALPVVETSFAGQNIDGLIGRDVLDRCVLVYNGALGAWTLSY